MEIQEIQEDQPAARIRIGELGEAVTEVVWWVKFQVNKVLQKG